MPESSKSLRDMVAYQTVEGGGSSGLQDKLSYLKGGPGSGFRTKLIVGLTLAAVSAGGAAFLANQWISNQYDRLRAMADQPQGEQTVQMPTRGVVVASRGVAYGEAVTRSDLSIIQWPASNVPSGTFESVEQVLSAAGSRFALARLSANEPVFDDKLSAPGQLASLAATLEPGMKAVTIRVDDVLGVAGLIQPTDRVDVIWTHSVGNNPQGEDAYAEMLLRDIQVLAIDQRVNDGEAEGGTDAHVARAVTIEVDVVQAQKIALAASTGKLSLALRHVGADVAESLRRVTMVELGIRQRAGNRLQAPQETETDRELAANDFGVSMRQASSGETPEQPAQPEEQVFVTDHYVVVGVRRGLERSEYNVLSDPR